MNKPKMQLTDTQKKRLNRLAKLAKDSPLAIFEYLAEIEDRLDRELPTLKNLMDKVKGERGDDGSSVKGDKGDRGNDGKDGMKGERGEQGIKGIDGKSGKDGRDGRDGRDGIDGRDGSPDMAEDVRNKLELLSGDERLDSKYIKGFENLNRIADIERMVQANAMPVTTSFYNGLRAKNLNIIGATASQQGDVVNITLPSSSGGVGAWTSLPVDGVTTSFAVANNPTDVNSDGTIFFGQNGYTWSSGTLTFINPPQQFAGYR